MLLPVATAVSCPIGTQKTDDMKLLTIYQHNLMKKSYSYPAQKRQKPFCTFLRVHVLFLQCYATLRKYSLKMVLCVSLMTNPDQRELPDFIQWGWRLDWHYLRTSSLCGPSVLSTEIQCIYMLSSCPYSARPSRAIRILLHSCEFVCRLNSRAHTDKIL